MSRKRFLAICAAASLSVMSVFPAFAAENENWSQKEGRWICTYEDGSPVTGWAEYEENWYYLDKTGTMRTGWVKDSGSWYYLDKDGVKVTSAWVDNYYVDEDGKMTKIR